MATFEEIKELARLPEKPVPLCLRGDLQVQYEDLEGQLKRARTAAIRTLAGASDEVAALEELMADLRKQMEDSIRVFTLRGLPKKKWSDLVAAHKPRDEDRVNRLDFNGQTFPVAVVQACCIDPVMTVKQVEELCDEILTQGQWDELFGGAFLLNRNNIEVPT